jgi:predicted dehydrogenase
MARAQWHKKTSWRATSSSPEQEKALNWRLSKATSLGLIGEMGLHPIDQAGWFLNLRPVSVTGFGTIAFWKDGREVPDTVQTIVEFPEGVRMIYDATLANSFDGEYEMLYGSDAAIMMRENKAWMFKEVDSPLLGWEVYASKVQFYKETGIALVAGASKAPPTSTATPEEEALTNTPLFHALGNFLRNADAVATATKDFVDSFGADDTDALVEHLSKNVHRQSAAGYLEGFQATLTAIKANEAMLTGQRIVLKPEWYELS